MKKLITKLLLTLTLCGVGGLKIFPVTISEINPHTKEVSSTVVYVNLLEEYNYTATTYEHFELEEETVTLKAFQFYIPNYVPKTYTITYNEDGNVWQQQYTYGEDVKLYTQKESDHPYEYAMGWVSEDKTYLKQVLRKPSGDIELTSAWQGKTYTIYYDNEAGDTYTYGKEFKLKTPKKSGYTFEGWYLDGEKITHISDVTYGDVYVKSKWKKIVYYNPRGYWVCNYRVLTDNTISPQELQRQVDIGPIQHLEVPNANLVHGHNPGPFSWVPYVQIGDTILMNGVPYVVFNKFVMNIQEFGPYRWVAPADLAIVTCYGDYWNGTRVFVYLERK